MSVFWCVACSCSMSGQAMWPVSGTYCGNFWSRGFWEDYSCSPRDSRSTIKWRWLWLFFPAFPHISYPFITRPQLDDVVSVKVKWMPFGLTVERSQSNGLFDYGSKLVISLSCNEFSSSNSHCSSFIHWYSLDYADPGYGVPFLWEKMRLFFRWHS